MIESKDRVPLVTHDLTNNIFEVCVDRKILAQMTNAKIDIASDQKLRPGEIFSPTCHSLEASAGFILADLEKRKNPSTAKTIVRVF